MQRRSFLKSLLVLVATPVVAKVVTPKEEPAMVIRQPRLFVAVGTSDCYMSDPQDPLKWEDLEPIYQEAKKQEERRLKILSAINSRPYTAKELREAGLHWTYRHNAHTKK